MAKLHSLPRGARIPDDIVRIAKEEGIQTASVVAIGGVSELALAYFDHKEKSYEERRFEEFLEVTSLAGNITLKDGKPFLHAHGNFGRRDLSVVGGHIMSAVVFPLLEVTLDPTSNTAIREFDKETGLNLIRRFGADSSGK